MKISAIAICVSLALIPALAGDDGPVRVALEPAPPRAGESGAVEPERNTSRIGEPVPVVVRIDAPDGFRLGQMEMVNPTDEFALVPGGEGPVLPTDSIGDGIEIPVVLVPFQIGELEFPGVRVPWAAPDGQTGEAMSGTWTVVVQATVDNAAEAEPADIRGPVDLPVPSPWWWLPAALLALGAVALLLWWSRRRPEPAAASVPLRPPDPFEGLGPDAWALRALDRLLADDVLGVHGTGRHHERLSEIVRRYIEGRFGIDTFERTSTEVIDALHLEKRSDPGPLATLKVVFEQSDLVKFARLQPPADESLRLVELARRFVTGTRPDPVSVGAAADDSIAESA